MSDINEVAETPAPVKTEGLSSQGMSAMRGEVAPPEPATPETVRPQTLPTPPEDTTTKPEATTLTIPPQEFTDTKGRDINVSTFPNGDSCMIRAYDKAKTPEIPDHATVSDVGMTNVTLEKGPDGNVERARLNDIEISNPEYRGTGIGSKMLSTAETYAQDAGAKELYGSFTPHGADPAEVQAWYEKQGYSLRPGPYGQEVFKTFPPKS